MGLDVSVSSFVGYPVSYRDIIEEKSEIEIKCDNCQSYLDSKKKFCADCGNKFVPVTKKVLTQAAKNLFKFTDPDYEFDGEDSWREVFEGVIFQGEAFQNYETDWENPVIGVGLYTSLSRHGPASGTSFKEVDAAVDRVVALVKAFGKDIRRDDVELYTVGYMSY